MKYLKLFEYYNQENFKQVLIDNMSKISLKEFEHEISQYKTMDEFIEETNEEDESEFLISFIVDVQRTYKQMFTNYLWKYKGPLEVVSMRDYIQKFPLVDKFTAGDNIKLGNILQKFGDNQYEIFRAIIGQNDNFYYVSKGSKIKMNDSIIGEDYTNDLAFDKFMDIATDIHSEIAASYLVKLIGEDIAEYQKFKNIEPESPFMSNCYGKIMQKLNKLLPSWMVRSNKTKLWELK